MINYSFLYFRATSCVQRALTTVWWWSECALALSSWLLCRESWPCVPGICGWKNEDRWSSKRRWREAGWQERGRKWKWWFRLKYLPPRRLSYPKICPSTSALLHKQHECAYIKAKYQNNRQDGTHRVIVHFSQQVHNVITKV